MHTLFVKIDDVSSDDESDEHIVTNEILMYMVHRKEALRQMGVEVQVQRVYVSDFERDDVVKALTRKGITRLPALMTDTKQVYIGVQNIVRVYENNIKSFMNGGGPPINPNDGNAVLANYYDNEINAWKKGVKHTKPVAEDEDQSIGDGGKDIERDHRLVILHPLRQMPRPLGGERHADAAFPRIALVAAQRRIAGGIVGTRPAVVGEKKHQSVFFETLAAQFLQQLRQANPGERPGEVLEPDALGNPPQRHPGQRARAQAAAVDADARDVEKAPNPPGLPLGNL